MKKLLCILIFIITIQNPLFAESNESIENIETSANSANTSNTESVESIIESENIHISPNSKITSDNKNSPTTIWDYARQDFITDALSGNMSFFDSKKQEIIDKEVEQNLGIKLIPTDLETCLKAAVEHNYTLKEKKFETRQNLWEKRNAYAQFLPTAEYNYSIYWLSGTFLVGGIVQDHVHEIPIQSNFTFNWDFFDKGKSFFGVSQRRSLYKASIAMQEFTREEVILKTATEYYTLLKNKTEIDIYATNMLDRKAQYDLTNARFQVGVGTKFDIYRAEAELAKAKQQYITAFNAIRTTQAKLANTTGIDVLTPLYPKDNVINEKNLSDIEVDKLIELSKKERQDIVAERKKISAMKAERSSQYTDFIPSVNAGFVYAKNGVKRFGLYPSTTFLITVNAPLGKRLGIGTFTKIKAYNEQIKAMETALIQKLRDIEASIITSKQDSASAKERIEASKKELFAAEKSLESSIVLMNTGEATFLDVIQAQGLKVAAQVGLAQNIADYNISQVQILFDAGIISVDSILNGVNYKP